MTDFLAYIKDEILAVSFEGVDFRTLKGKLSEQNIVEASYGEQQEEEWEEVEVSDDELVAPAAPSASLVGSAVLDLVNDLSEEPMDLTDNFLEHGLDSISVSLLLNKIASQFKVQLTMAEVGAMDSVQDLVEEIMRKGPAQEPQRVRRRKKVMRRRARRVARVADDLEDDDAVAKKPTTGPTMEVGTHVRIAGVRSRPELNDLAGVLVAFHFAEECWQVRPSDGSACKLLREANLVAVDFAEARPGLRVLRPAPGGPHVYVVHSLGDDIVDDGLATAAARYSIGHVCAILFDGEAEQCDSLQALADLYETRLRFECRSKGGFMCGPVTLAASSFGCPIAHQMALQLSQAGVDVALLFFDQGLARPPASALLWEGREWLGGEAEVALLFARMLGAGPWAAAEERSLLQRPGQAGAVEDLLMRTYWEVVAQTGLAVKVFQDLVSELGRKYDRLQSLMANYEPAAIFEGPVDFVLSPEAEADARFNLHAARLDGVGLLE